MKLRLIFTLVMAPSLSGQHTDPRHLSALCDALLDDVKLGNVQAAILHHEQIGIAVSPLVDNSDDAAVGQKWRDLFAHSLKTLAQRPWIPTNEKLTDTLLTDALQVRGATYAGDWDLAQSTLRVLSEKLLTYESERSNLPSDEMSLKIQNQEHAEYALRLMKDFLGAWSTAARSPRLIFETEPLAPLALLETMRSKWPWCNCYDELGMSSLARGDFESARQYLLASVGEECQGGRIFGVPSKLAAALLCRGYDNDILIYLTRLQALGKGPPDPDLWVAQTGARCR